MHSNRSRGFTLIELLVVIAIIAILAAILFPVFAQAREKARQATCIANEKQLALACVMYNGDNNETYPIGWDVYTVGGATHVQSWPLEIAPYVKSTGVFVCPDDSNAGQISATLGESISYASNGETWMNWGGTWGTPTIAILVGPMGIGGGGGSADGGTNSIWDAPEYGALKLSQVSLPDSSIMLFEKWSSDIARARAANDPHLTAGEVDTPAYNWTNSPSGLMISDGNSDGRGIPNANSTDTDWSYSPFGAASQHPSGGFVAAASKDPTAIENFAFCDGHVKAEAPTLTHPCGWGATGCPEQDGLNQWDAIRSATAWD